MSHPMEAETESVLVVDDEPAVRALVQDILLSQGYPVLDAGGPWEALSVAEAHPIGLLLTDVMMPEMDGGELAKRIESLRPHTKVLFMSGYAPAGLLDPRANFIAKPFTVAHIVQAVSDVLGR